MNQRAELDKVKARIHHLTKKTVEAGCSEAEAMSAMNMVGNLLSQYHLTMEEIDIRETRCKTIKIPTLTVARHAIDNVIIPIASLFEARVWRSCARVPDKKRGYKKEYHYCFFGQEQDLEMIEYLYSVVWNALEGDAREFKKSETYKNSTDRKAAFLSFQRGMAFKLASRFAELKFQNEQEMKKFKTTGTALLVLKGQLVEEEFSKENLKLVKHHSNSRLNLDHDAYHGGTVAGDKVSLTRPLKDRDGPKGLLS